MAARHLFPPNEFTAADEFFYFLSSFVRQSAEEGESDMNHDEYEWCKAHRICPVCKHAKAAPGRVQCLDCLDAGKIRAERSRQGKSAEERERMRAAHRRNYKSLTDSRRAAGLCIRCGKPARSGRTMCTECSLRSRNQQRRKREAARQRKPADACRFCDCKALDGFKVCRTHYDRLAETRTHIKTHDAARQCVDALWKVWIARRRAT